jgi:hypothetical protein
VVIARAPIATHIAFVHVRVSVASSNTSSSRASSGRGVTPSSQKSFPFFPASHDDADRDRAMFRRALTTASSSSAGVNPHAFLLENPLKLYRDCIRLADLLAAKQGHPRETLRATVRAPWRRHQKERDPARVMELREGAVRGLSNYMMYEASRGAMEGVPAFVAERVDGNGEGDRGPRGDGGGREMKNE